MLYDQWLVRAHKWDLTVLSQKSRYALLAQLVEQLTLNQWVLGSSPRWCTTYLLPCFPCNIGDEKGRRKICQRHVF